MKSETISEVKFRELCFKYGGPDMIDLNELPEPVAACLCGADRFLETADEALAELRRFGLVEE